MGDKSLSQYLLHFFFLSGKRKSLQRLDLRILPVDSVGNRDNILIIVPDLYFVEQFLKETVAFPKKRYQYLL
jgi:hypothetical protein